MYLIHNYQHWTSLAIKQANGVSSNQYLLSLVLISRACREKQKSHNQIPEDYFVYILVVYDMLLCITLLLETDMSAVSWEIDANLWRIFICWALHQNHSSLTASRHYECKTIMTLVVYHSSMLSALCYETKWWPKITNLLSENLFCSVQRVVLLQPPS